MAETGSSLSQIITELPTLSKPDSGQLFDFLRHRLMDFGVIEDDRKQKFHLIERFGSRPWLDIDAMKLKAALVDALEEYRYQPSRITEDRVRAAQHDLMQQLRSVYKFWVAKMRTCREEEEAVLEKLLNPDAPAAEKSDLPPATSSSPADHQVSDSQCHSSDKKRRKLDHGGEDLPERTVRPPREQYSHQRRNAGGMSRYYPPAPSYGPNEHYPRYERPGDPYHATQSYDYAPYFNCADDQYSRHHNYDPYPVDRDPYAHHHYSQFSGSMPGCSRWEPPYGGPFGEPGYMGRRPEPTWYHPRDRYPRNDTPPYRGQRKSRGYDGPRRETSKAKSNGQSSGEQSGGGKGESTARSKGVPREGLTPTGTDGAVVRVRPPQTYVLSDNAIYYRKLSAEKRKRKAAMRIADKANKSTVEDSGSNDTLQ